MDPPLCGSCDNFLAEVDMQKTTGRYWVNCKRCRDEHTAARRKRRAQEAFDDEFIDYDYFDYVEGRYRELSQETEYRYPSTAQFAGSRPQLEPETRVVQHPSAAIKKEPRLGNETHVTVKKEREKDASGPDVAQEEWYDALEEPKLSLRECSVGISDAGSNSATSVAHLIKVLKASTSLGTQRISVTAVIIHLGSLATLEIADRVSERRLAFVCVEAFKLARKRSKPDSSYRMMAA
ncbi:uncharacterized protein J4E88_004787 [Alternaria novae-zelandiae]|uniref:uncharacterized protein n=1 Tax=Alternaria novae-zelandiae TaxID=430562 RepID=UPI0020C410AF|nr:uncharacterized protein J4E88_004787 [Alternaria novae-zelandiae]KAI4683611.1 hypothetical protein J4E88_004787 [Alternaria novae-zelandiae]